MKVKIFTTIHNGITAGDHLNSQYEKWVNGQPENINVKKVKTTSTDKIVTMTLLYKTKKHEPI